MQRRQVALGTRVVPCPLREIAIRTDIRTEREMDVDAGGGDLE
jgi:hypothetical protein